MDLKTIHNFSEFTSALKQAGFSAGGENAEGIFALSSLFGSEIRWHTGDAETDPWEWRMRVLDEREDIAYAKVFFKKSGFITKEWYPYFLAARRNRKTFAEAYADGTVSAEAKRIYELIERNGSLPLHLIKREGGFKKEDNSRFERALTELQMRLYVTMCGRSRKRSAKGEEYGWNSTVFCTAEHFFEKAIFERAERISEAEAEEAITEQVFLLNPEAGDRQVQKFIFGK